MVVARRVAGVELNLEARGKAGADTLGHVEAIVGPVPADHITVPCEELVGAALGARPDLDVLVIGRYTIRHVKAEIVGGAQERLTRHRSRDELPCLRGRGGC